MDGRGRLAEPLTGGGTSPAEVAVAMLRHVADTWRASARARRPGRLPHGPGRTERWLYRRLHRCAALLAMLRFNRGGGIAASVLIITGAAAYGTVAGGHFSDVIAAVKNARDLAANAAGFHIESVALSGQRHLTRDEIFARAGITGTTSLLFLDVADTRSRLMADSWIADATIQKLYPDRLLITVTEREAFALWQKDGQVSVIAADGTVMEPVASRPFAALPMVVGRGAQGRARDFLALLDRYPAIRDNVRASILVADRRWNLRLRNGIDVRLPESDVAAALDRLAALDRDRKLLSRDLTVVDLRLPDRVTVRLSDAVAQARDAALKDKAKQKKGGNA